MAAVHGIGKQLDSKMGKNICTSLTSPKAAPSAGAWFGGKQAPQAPTDGHSGNGILMARRWTKKPKCLPSIVCRGAKFNKEVAMAVAWSHPCQFSRLRRKEIPRNEGLRMTEFRGDQRIKWIYQRPGLFSSAHSMRIGWFCSRFRQSQRRH